MKYDSEEEFLRNYNADKYEKMSVSSEILIFSVADENSDNYRKLSNKKFTVLMVKRDNYPFKDKWCLPGGFVNLDETTINAAKRILKDETNIENIYLEQLYTFDSIDRDPRMRVLSTTYMALIDKNRLNTKVVDSASWFNMDVVEDEKSISVTFDNKKESFNIVIKKTLRELTTDRYEYSIIKNDHIAFDHPLSIVAGISRLKNKLEYTDIVFNMMPKYFTLGELQMVYEVILDKKLLAPAFRRIIQNKVEKTDKLKTGEGHRPSVLYKYKEAKDEKIDK